VAPLEELLFRGAIFGALRNRISWQNALFFSSCVFGIVHFFSKPIPPTEIHWDSGFYILAQMISGFGQWKMLLPGFLNLFLVGIILGWVYQYTGSLYFSIGLHGGWIFWLKISGSFTQPIKDIPLWFWGTHKLTDGWLCFILLTTTWLLLLWKPPQARGMDKARR
jgi:membrane protease YdiL (CAAX protease family)